MTTGKIGNPKTPSGEYYLSPYNDWKIKNKTKARWVKNEIAAAKSSTTVTRVSEYRITWSQNKKGKIWIFKLNWVLTTT